MIAAMGDALPEEVKVTIDPYNGVPDIKTQRNIVNTYMHLFPDVENAVMERVQELNTNYFGPKPKTSPTSSGSPQQPKIPGVPGGGGSPANHDNHHPEATILEMGFKHDQINQSYYADIQTQRSEVQHQQR